MNEAVRALLAIVSGVITLAIIAVLISRNAQTPQVISSAGNALSNVIGSAVSPVTGGSTQGVNGTGGGFGNLGSSTFSNILSGALI